MSDYYTGSIDEEQVNDLIRDFGKIVEDADEAGFIVTYHAAKGDKVGRVDVAGRYVDNDLLQDVLRDVIRVDAAEGRCR